MEHEVLVRHGTDWRLIGHQSRKVGADVGGLPVERNHAVSLCAAPQTPYLRPTLTEAAALLSLAPRTDPRRIPVFRVLDFQNITTQH